MANHSRWQEVSGNAAEIYERHLVPAMFAPWVPTLIDLAQVQRGERVLDVACGTGIAARHVAGRVGSDGHVVGLDINAAMLAVAKALPLASGATIQWLEASALDMPLPDAAFDVVLCQQGLQQFPDRAAGLREMHRVLASDGRLVVSVWSHIEGSPGMAALVQALERHVGVEAANNRRAPFALSDATALHDLIVDAGFRDVRVSTLVEMTRFPSSEALVDAQLAATPLSTLGSLDDATREAVTQDVRVSLEHYVHGDRFAVPMEAHVAIARK